MRILIANKFMYNRGGDCIVALLTAKLLRDHGHEVRLYAMDYPDNLLLPEVPSYAPRVTFDGSLSDRLKAVKRMMGKGDIKKSFGKVLDNFKPDVVHLHNIHSYLSPVLGEMAANMGIRVVWTQHDFKLLCPSYLCRRPDGTNCTDCFGGDLYVIKHRCMKGSYPASFLAHQEAMRWNHKRLEKSTSVFICPSEFMAECFVNAGFNRDKIRVLNNFASPDKLEGKKVEATPEPYFCYIGRLSAEKGIVTLLEAAKQACIRLKVAGTGPLEDELKDKYGSVEKIEFLGHLDADGVGETLRKASASIMPSECFENNPLSVIESLSFGTPVIGAVIGGIPELLRDDADGLRKGVSFPSGDVATLAEILGNFKAGEFDRALIADRARANFSPERHYEQLMRIYTSV